MLGLFMFHRHVLEQILDDFSFIFLLAFFFICYQLPRTQIRHKCKSQGKCDAGLKGGNALLIRVSHVLVLKILCLKCLSVPPHEASVYMDYMCNWLFIQFCRSVDKKPSFIFICNCAWSMCFILLTSAGSCTLYLW